MEASSDPIFVEQLNRLLPDSKVLLSEPFNLEAARRWYIRAVPLYRRLYGPESASIKTLNELREGGLLQGRGNITAFRVVVAEFIALATFLQDGATRASSVTASRPSRPPATRNIFIIHGHDELNLLRLQTMLREHFKLEPIVISSRPGQSRPIIGKFEEHAKDCTFAISLFTPDDEVVDGEKKYSQARPNVIFETGWFVGRLGKERVLILLKDGTKIHSDFDGVSRIQFRDDVQDAYIKLQGELKASGIL